MPSKSKSQQRLFGMALAVRRGELKRSEVGKEVLDIVDGEMTNRQIEDFAKKRTSDRERVTEGKDIFGVDYTGNAAEQTYKVTPSENSGSKEDSPITRYLKNLQYSGEMKPIISVRPDTRYVFVVVKPGFAKMSQEIIEKFQDSGFDLYKTRTKMLSMREAKRMYAVHKEEDFYEDLCKYMSNDLSIGILFTYPENWAVESAFQKTSILKDGIRKQYQESDMRNVMHSSDNLENMRVECSMYFNELF